MTWDVTGARALLHAVGLEVRDWHGGRVDPRRRAAFSCLVAPDELVGPLLEVVAGGSPPPTVYGVSSREPDSNDATISPEARLAAERVMAAVLAVPDPNDAAPDDVD